MRPVETLLVIVNLLTFLLLVTQRRRAASWTRYSAAAALVIAAAQTLSEGPRWQMLPAYALSGMCLLVSLQRRYKPPGPIVVLSGAAWLAASAALPILLPVFGFPHPSGPYAIGTLTYHWVDETRPDVYSANPNDRRELMVQIWYPASVDPSAPNAPWVQDADALAPAVVHRGH